MQVRGYAKLKKEQCVGTQSRRRHSAWVRSATEVQVRTQSKNTRRDSIYECVAAVAVRGAIVSLGAYPSSLTSRQRSALTWGFLCLAHGI